MSQRSNLVAKAFAALDSFPVKLSNFILLARDKSLVICVFEGDDHHYYGPRIDSYLPPKRKRRNFPMGGKDNVLGLYELRSENPDVFNAPAIYFVDKDFGAPQITQQPRLYVTPCYSIENFYLEESVFRAILADAFKLPEKIQIENKEVVNSHHEAVVKIFRQVMEQAHQTFLIRTSAFIIAAREKLKELPELKAEGQLCIQQLSVNEFVKVTPTKLIENKPATLKNLAFSLNAHDLVSEAKLGEKEEMLKTTDYTATCRGKYSFAIFAAYMQLLWEDAKKTVPKIFTSKQEARLAFSESTALADLSAYASTPDCLKAFLRTEFANI